MFHLNVTSWTWTEWWINIWSLWWSEVPDRVRFLWSSCPDPTSVFPPLVSHRSKVNFTAIHSRHSQTIFDYWNYFGLVQQEVVSTYRYGSDVLRVVEFLSLEISIFTRFRVLEKTRRTDKNRLCSILCEIWNIFYNFIKNNNMQTDD